MIQAKCPRVGRAAALLTLNPILKMLDPPPDNNFWLALSVSIITNLIQVSFLLYEPHSAYCNSRPFFITRP